MFAGMCGGPGMPGMRGMMHGGFGRGRRWHDVPTREEVIAELERYQRDLEEETLAVAARIKALRGQSGTGAGAGQQPPAPPAGPAMA